MPIISENDKPYLGLNGDTGNTVLLNSLDDEESFVVLERSTASNEGLNLDVGQSTQNFQSFPNSCSFPVFNNNMTSSAMTISRSSHVSQGIPLESSGFMVESPISVSVEDIQKRLQDVLHENINLKENLYQTNLAMKQQLSTMSLLQDRTLEVQRNHQAKFEETKVIIQELRSEKNDLQQEISTINGELDKLKEENKILKEANKALETDSSKLKEENQGLKESNVAFGSEASKLLFENANLKKQLSSTQESLQILNESGRRASLQPTPKEVELHEVVDQLTRKLEVVERARRQQDFDIDRLQAQLARAVDEVNESQRRLAHSQNELQLVHTQVKNDNSLPYGEKVLKYDGLLKQLKESIQEEQTRFNSLSSWLTMTDPTGNTAQFEISELRRLLAEEQTQSVARKESLYRAVSTIHDLLGDFQKLGADLERVKADYAVKESHGLAYDEMQKKGFRERLDSLTAKLVEKEEALAISERHLASLQEAVRLENDEKKASFKDHLHFKFEDWFKRIVSGVPSPTSIDNGETKSLNERIKALSKELAAKEEILKTITQETNKLKEEVMTLRSTNETIPVLQEQAKIYQVDFEAERKSRESLVTEKEELLDGIRQLQARNQELIDELNRMRNCGTRDNVPSAPAANTRQPERSPTPEPPRPQDEVVPTPKRYYCPNPECNMMFTTVDPLQLHVITCLKLDD